MLILVKVFQSYGTSLDAKAKKVGFVYCFGESPILDFKLSQFTSKVYTCYFTCSQFSKLFVYFNIHLNAGGGCFKCGSPDHIAKDCTGDSTTKQNSKFTLRDDNTQRGGNRNTRQQQNAMYY